MEMTARRYRNRVWQKKRVGFLRENATTKLKTTASVGYCLIGDDKLTTELQYGFPVMCVFPMLQLKAVMLSTVHLHVCDARVSVAVQCLFLLWWVRCGARKRY